MTVESFHIGRFEIPQDRTTLTPNVYPLIEERGLGAPAVAFADRDAHIADVVGFNR